MLLAAAIIPEYKICLNSFWYQTRQNSEKNRT